MARTKRQPRRQTEKPDLLQGPGLFVRFGWRFLIIPLSFGKNQQRVGPMKDYQAQLEKLRKDAAECALIRDLATDKICAIFASPVGSSQSWAYPRRVRRPASRSPTRPVSAPVARWHAGPRWDRANRPPAVVGH